MKISTIRFPVVIPHTHQGKYWLLSGLFLLANQITTVVYAASPNDIQLQSYIPNKYPANSPEILFPAEEELIAQIIPDDTLGSEGSIVIDNGNSDFINGGAIRGANLFHSFQDFNVNTGQQVYFVNPEGIGTILSRVTGSNVSNIDGLLGVDGTADLFLLNPNGISFGPNAELDIRGAFTASTADTLEFTDGSVFSAVNPQGTSFLTMSVPLGVQFGNSVQGNITSTGILETGQGLTLFGNQLYLEGQLMAGGNLALQAQDTVTIRDTATDAFITRSGNDLTIQGNQGIDIWTLQHLEHTPFISRGDLTLISGGTISGDAHFESGGNFQLLTLERTPGNFVSFHDPSIFADGDVILGDYTGASLKVEATGSIQGGDISITGPDTTLVADGSGSDEDLLASNRTAILRSGVNLVSPPNLPQTVGGTTFEEGTVADQPPGSIIIDSINTSDNNGGDAGSIIISATGNIIINGKLESLSVSTVDDSGNGGSISITSSSGDISINDEVNTFSYSYAGNSGNAGSISISALGDISARNLNSVSASMKDPGNSSNGGNISISSISGDITINGNVASPSSSEIGNAGNGGDISIEATLGNITINNSDSLTSSSSFARNGNTGNGGNISISSKSDITIDGRLDSYSDSVTGATSNAGNISISSMSGDIRITQDVRATSYSSSGVTGNGGDITISSMSGDIISDGELNSSSASFQTSGDAGDGGNIILSSTSGDITTNERLNSFSFSNSNLGDAGNGGDIVLSSTSGDITTNERLNSSSLSSSRSAGDGGSISIESLNSGNITINKNLDLFSFSLSGTAGSGGDITLLTEDGLIMGNDTSILAFSVAPGGGTTGAGGLANLEASNIFGIEIFTLSSDGESGNIDIQGLGKNLTISNLNLTTSRQVDIMDPFDPNNRIPLDLSNFGQSGNTIITSAGNLNLTDVDIRSNTNRATDAGDIQFLSSGTIQLNNSQILSNTSANSTGNGGNVTFVANDNVVLNSTIFNTDTGGSGRAGSISIRDAEVVKLDNTELITSSNGPGGAGSIFIQNVDLLLMRRGSLILADASTTGGGGNVDIDASFVFTIPEEDNDILANSLFGQGGVIDINANLIVGFREVEQFSPTLRGNFISDISASSNFGIDGTVRLDADPAPELTELPTDLVDPANRITQGCRAEDFTSNDGPPGDFIITGRGGQRLEPTDIASEDAPLDDLGPDIIQPESSKKPDTESSIPTAPNRSQLTDAQEAIVTESGEVFLVADTAWRSSVSCAALHPPS
ncbi:two-partner secretion domain-containing protein [Leptothoe spongobia]|uniref:Filamentous hemagglutinin N-terminal domain-containing protein n=1 Tax=Leptothoe spongobia TAU-MAC 1115 TaxID=1967444 RepID=A0A947DD07_9CYAN|nr:filamentous hemagglutinin N-terminal domain-containing protein [Leptothoe spongobia]MBT9314836.1 filamentous hemagglutinin N-terminal domain-containing protein [Leptothoe spongobia TAU-MAC 1115]